MKRSLSSVISVPSVVEARLFPLVLLLVIGFTFAGCDGRSDALVVSGRIEREDVHVGSRVGGRVARVAKQEGEAVAAGEVILELEADELTAQRAQAAAAAAQAEAQLALLEAPARKEDIAMAEGRVAGNDAALTMAKKGFRAEEVREAEATLESATADAEYARLEYERGKSLIGTGGMEQRELERRHAVFETAAAAERKARSQAELMRSGSRPEEIAMAEATLAQSRADLDKLRNGARPEEIAASRAALESARANLARIDAQLKEMTIRSPLDSTVETSELRPGDLVKAGETVAVLNLKTAPFVRCYVPENRLGTYSTGMKVWVAVDTFPGEKFTGVVRRVSADAEFTPRNVQTTEKRSELVFEMKVDLTGDVTRLRPGMYADVHFESGGK